MKKIWTINSTTVRALLARGARRFQQRLPQLVARLAESHFTRTAPRPVPRLGLTERPQHTWELEAEGERLKVYGWGASLEIADKLALLSHGWNSNAWDLYPLVERLRQLGYTVVGFDQVGHGRSSGQHSSFPQFARNLERVARLLPRVDLLVGHSMGGAAAALAISRGLQVSAAVLLAPPADLRVYMQRFADGYGLTPEVIGTLQSGLERREKVELANLVPEIILPHLRIKALILCDRKDREVGLEAAERYARHWPGSRLVVTDGLGHKKIVSDPRGLDAIENFLSERESVTS